MAPATAAAEPGGDDDTVEVGDDEPAPSADAAEDDEAPPPRAAASTASVELDADAGKAKRGKAKGGAKGKGKAKRGRGSADDAKPEPYIPLDRNHGAAARAIEAKKPWIKRWIPQRDTLEVGFYLGGFFLPTRHGLWDAGFGPRPSLNRAAFAGGVRVAYNVLSFLGLALEVGGMPTRSPSEGANASMYTFRMLVFGQLPFRVTPTLALGGGLVGIRSAPRILHDLDSAFVWGPGVKVHANQWIALRVDGRHIVTPGEGASPRSYGEVVFGLDLTVRLRRLVRPRKLDRDEDGLYDRDDACPFEAADTDDGCPTDRDTDNDGVPDSRDRCPKDWGDGAGGCPIPDTDGDGVLDGKDECESEPETHNGFKDLDGCPDEVPAVPPAALKQLTGVIEGITFDSSASTIRPSSRAVLDKVVKTLKDNPTVRIEIVGHTDDAGAREANVALSQARAEAVKQYLVDAGVEGDRMTTRGEGPDAPIADNRSKAGRAKNRRIEFKVVP